MAQQTALQAHGCSGPPRRFRAKELAAVRWPVFELPEIPRARQLVRFNISSRSDARCALRSVDSQLDDQESDLLALIERVAATEESIKGLLAVLVAGALTDESGWYLLDEQRAHRIRLDEGAALLQADAVRSELLRENGDGLLGEDGRGLFLERTGGEFLSIGALAEM